MDTNTIIGVLGATIILVTFLLNQFGKWSVTSRSYDVANALGSLILIIYAALLESLPFLVLNTVWFVFSFLDVIKSLRKNPSL
jgi:hypothetical protein